MQIGSQMSSLRAGFDESLTKLQPLLRAGVLAPAVIPVFESNRFHRMFDSGVIASGYPNYTPARKRSRPRLGLAALAALAALSEKP